VGRAVGRAGYSFSAEFGRAHMRTSIWASHLGRAERPFSVEVGNAQMHKPG
jgi:hypothetical protein